MGVRNYLIEGVSGTGKTAVCNELKRRGYHAINGDRELAYQGDPKTGEPLDGFAHAHHIWNVDKVRALVADQSHRASFFCGGSRNFNRYIDMFDAVFVLEVDRDTLNRRLAARPENEFGGRSSERQLIVRLHATKEDIPKIGFVIDATRPITSVVDDILGKWSRRSALGLGCVKTQRRSMSIEEVVRARLSSTLILEADSTCKKN